MKKIDIELNVKSIDKAIKDLEAYRDSLQDKCVEFVNRLYAHGYQTAKQTAGIALNDLGEVGSYIQIIKEDAHYIENGFSALMVMCDLKKIRQTWVGNEEGVLVSPSLMAEFGSGNHANAKAEHMAVLNVNVEVGQGTFPGQKHAFEKAWHWKTEDGKWHTSSGITPTMPMYHAYIEMLQELKSIAKEVF